MRGRGMDSENILYGNFELPSEEQARKIRAKRKRRQKEKQIEAKADQVRKQRRTPLQEDQMDALLRSKAKHPLLARRYGISAEELERYRQARNYLHRASPHHAFTQCLHQIYPPGTRAVIMDRWGTLTEYGGGAAFEIEWDDGGKDSVLPREFGLFLIAPEDEAELRVAGQP